MLPSESWDINSGYVRVFHKRPSEAKGGIINISQPPHNCGLDVHAGWSFFFFIGIHYHRELMNLRRSRKCPHSWHTSALLKRPVRLGERGLIQDPSALSARSLSSLPTAAAGDRGENWFCLAAPQLSLPPLIPPPHCRRFSQIATLLVPSHCQSELTLQARQPRGQRRAFEPSWGSLTRTVPSPFAVLSSQDGEFVPPPLVPLNGRAGKL